MKILLINVDAPFNLAIRRMYNFYKKDNQVEMKDLGLKGYPHKKRAKIDASGYSQVFVSNIFDINKERVEITGCQNVKFGGIGSRNPGAKLPGEIEQTDPFYFDYEDTSYGFITRGCIRNCWFCKVPKYEGALKFYNSVENVIKHHKVKFLDNNILAYPRYDEVFEYLIENNIRCEFNQGLDFRLVDDTNAWQLSRLNYMGEYIFAFDDIAYQKAIEKKLRILKKYIPQDWKLKFYIYQNANMPIAHLIHRAEWCRSHKCKPYVMRDANIWNSEHKDFYTDYTAYCNQPAFFKKMDFEAFLYKRHSNPVRIQQSLRTYEGAVNQCITQ